MVEEIDCVPPLFLSEVIPARPPFWISPVIPPGGWYSPRPRRRQGNRDRSMVKAGWAFLRVSFHRVSITCQTDFHFCACFAGHMHLTTFTPPPPPGDTREV